MLTVAIVIGILLAAILGYAATKPGVFRVQRAKSIQAPPAKIFELINDFHRWVSWSPWEKLDPTMKKTFSGAASGKGAVYAWAGNSKAGEGRMEITDTTPGSKVTIKLDFLKPFEGHNTAEFTLEPKGEFTSVTWAMFGPVPFVMKVMSTFFSMDKMLGRDFEAGLTNMKAIAEN
jgi:uncharacterized protein YndB with AHSA1/START domain